MRPPPERTDTEARTSLPPHVGVRQPVVDVERDGAARAERDPGLVRLVHLDLEADAAAGEPAGDAGAAAGEQALAVEVVDVERDGRPAGGGVGVRQHVEHGLGAGRCGGGGRPCPHGGNGPIRARRASSASLTILRRRTDDPASSSRMTPGWSARRTKGPARARRLCVHAAAAIDPRARPEPRPRRGSTRWSRRCSSSRPCSRRRCSYGGATGTPGSRVLATLVHRGRARRAPARAARRGRARDGRLRRLPAARPRDQRQRLRPVLRGAVRPLLVRRCTSRAGACCSAGVALTFGASLSARVGRRLRRTRPSTCSSAALVHRRRADPARPA